jgi:hypothetical protein
VEGRVIEGKVKRDVDEEIKIRGTRETKITAITITTKESTTEIRTTKTAS